MPMQLGLPHFARLVHLLLQATETGRPYASPALTLRRATAVTDQSTIVKTTVRFGVRLQYECMIYGNVGIECETGILQVRAELDAYA